MEGLDVPREGGTSRESPPQGLVGGGLDPPEFFRLLSGGGWGVLSPGKVGQDAAHLALFVLLFLLGFGSGRRHNQSNQTFVSGRTAAKKLHRSAKHYDGGKEEKQ